MISEWTFINQTEPKEPQIQEEGWLAVGKNEGVGDDWVEYEDDPKAKELQQYSRTIIYCCVRCCDFAKVREASRLRREEDRKKRENILLRKAK